MKAVLDSVVINHLLRRPRRERRRRGSARTATVLDEHLRAKNLILYVDPQFALVDEWKRTSGQEAVQQLVIRWVDLDALLTVEALRTVGPTVTRRLRQLGFRDTVDKLILRIALALDDRNVVSNDGDFWDPLKPGRACPIGKHSAPVAALLASQLVITVHTLRQLLNRISS